MINAFTNKNFVEELNIPYFQKTWGKAGLKGISQAEIQRNLYRK